MKNLTEAIQSFKTTYSILMKDISDAGYANFERLCAYASENKMLVLRKAVDQNDEILAIALLLFHGKRLYLLQSTTLPKGRNKEANYFLLNNIISEFSNRDLILDFEGSDVPGIAHFYKSFGSSDQPYYLFKYNNLPWPLKLLKQ